MENKNNNILNEFGELLANKMRDTVYRHFLMTIEGKFKSEEDQIITNHLKKFSPEQLDFIKNIVLSTIDSSSHYFLWMIEKSDDFDLINKKNGEIISLKKISDGLCGELYGEDGWIKKYSKYSTTFG